MTIQRAGSVLSRRNGHRSGEALRKFAEMANTGRTPGQGQYTDEGIFILKVGNLTGRGIGREPRDRNFILLAEGLVEPKAAGSSCARETCFLHRQPMLPDIAKKVGIIFQIPENYGGVTFVGEIIHIRPLSGVDPFILLAA